MLFEVMNEINGKVIRIMLLIGLIGVYIMDNKCKINCSLYNG